MTPGSKWTARAASGAKQQDRPPVAIRTGVPLTAESGKGSRYDKAGVNLRSLDTVSTSAELKSAGLKATIPRLKILEIFQNGMQRHMSAEDVYKELLAEGNDVGLATVYRVLTQFEQAGLLTRSNFESGKSVFEIDEGKHHDHLVCLQCGRVEEFYDADIEKRQQKVAADQGFELQDHSLALYGNCRRRQCPNRPA